MKMLRTLRKWGNSNGIRLPKEVLEAVNLKPNQKIMVTVHNGVIVLTPLKERPSYLEKMLEKVTPEDIKGEWDWGLDVGNELYE